MVWKDLGQSSAYLQQTHGFYNQVKHHFAPELFLQLKNHKKAKCIAWLRTSSHRLNVETGRYGNRIKSIHHRACDFCCTQDRSLERTRASGEPPKLGSYYGRRSPLSPRLWKLRGLESRTEPQDVQHSSERHQCTLRSTTSIRELEIYLQTIQETISVLKSFSVNSHLFEAYFILDFTRAMIC